jgi:hypothetical protein
VYKSGKKEQAFDQEEANTQKREEDELTKTEVPNMLKSSHNPNHLPKEGELGPMKAKRIIVVNGSSDEDETE